MNIRRLESHATYQAWGTGSGNPTFMILTCLVVNIISLMVAIGVNATASNEDGDYGYVLICGDIHIMDVRLIPRHQ
jgi:hypothetical protein